MNRSRRRVTVICWAIAAGVLYGWAGAVVLVPARADPAAENPSDGARSASSRAGDTAGYRNPRQRGPASPRAGATPSGPRDRRISGSRPEPVDDGDEGADEWWCQWWPAIVPPPVPAANETRGWLAGLIAVSPASPVFPPVGTLGPGPVDIAAVPAPLPSAPVAQAAPPAPAAPVAPAVGPQPVAPGPPPFAPGPPPVAPLSGPVPSGPPQSPADAGGGPVESARLGYPEYLRRAGAGQVLAAALPGLAALAGVTALGGFFGYRQARAGYLLRTAGAGRFLR